MGSRVADRHQHPTGPLPCRHRNRGLPARPAGPCHPDASGQPAHRRRRRFGQDHRERIGGPRTDAAPPYPVGAHRVSVGPADSVARADARQVRPGLPHRRQRGHEAASAQPRPAREPMEPLPAAHHIHRLLEARAAAAADARGAIRHQGQATASRCGIHKTAPSLSYAKNTLAFEKRSTASYAMLYNGESADTCPPNLNLPRQVFLCLFGSISSKSQRYRQARLFAA